MCLRGWKCSSMQQPSLGHPPSGGGAESADPEARVRILVSVVYWVVCALGLTSNLLVLYLMKAQHEGALPPPCIVRKDPRSAGALGYRAWAQSWSSAALAARSVLPSMNVCIEQEVLFQPH